MAPAPKARVCTFYTRNACMRGDRCPYLHSADETNPSSRDARAPPSICHFFLNGSCQHGALCRFQHPIEEKTIQPIKKACAFYQQNKCNKGTACPFLHDGTLSSPPSSRFGDDIKVSKSFGPCKFFAQGRCTKGLDCPFPHPASAQMRVASESPPIPPSTSLSVVQLIHDPSGERAKESKHGLSPLSDRSIDKSNREVSVRSSQDIPPVIRSEMIAGTQVFFGSGASVDKVVTAFESCRMILSNLPDDITQTELIDTLGRFGQLQKVLLSKTLDFKPPSANIEFNSPDEADQAVKELNGLQYRLRALRAQLDLRAVENGTATLRSSKIKVSWYAPTQKAWAHYSSIHRAQTSARNLNGRTFNGRKLTAAFQPPSRRQTESFTVVLKGLSPPVRVYALEQLCATDRVTVGEVAYDTPQSIVDVRALLEACGSIEAFDTFPDDGKHTKIKAFAHFTSADEAAAAVKKLNNVSQAVLGYSPLFLELIHSVKYNIPARQFLVLKELVDSLRSESGECSIRCYDRDHDGAALDPVCIRLYSVDPNLLGQTKTALERLLAGDTIRSQGEAIWDDFFQTPDGQEYIVRLCESADVFIRCDTRRRSLHLVGSREGKDRAYAAVTAKSVELAAQRHKLTLDKIDLRYVLQTYDKLQELVGADKISLDVVTRTLTIHGNDEEVDLIKDAVKKSNADPGTLIQASQDGVECPVCFCEAENTVELPCGHLYCKACLLHLLRSVPDTKVFPVKCVADDGMCSQALPIRIFRDLLPSESESRIYDAAFLSYIHRRPHDFRYCPTPDCQTIYRPGPVGTVLRCPSCLSRICPACHIEFHEGLTCHEWKDNISGGQQAYEKWRRENNVKPCPNCSADLQKSSGCNHMKCIRCQTHMCWVCMKTFSNQGTDGGIYPHMRNVHGGIGI